MAQNLGIAAVMISRNQIIAHLYVALEMNVL
jgi:hypothetical protein